MMRGGFDGGGFVAVRALCLALVLLSAVAPAVAAAPSTPLGKAGRWITDAEGRVVILHGWNMVNKLPPYHPSALGFGEDDARFLRDEGFNTIRLGIIYKGLEPEPGRYEEAYLDRIAQTVEVLRRNGLLVLLDFHQDMYNERFNGEGFPDWAVQDDGLPAEPDQGFPANNIVMPALSRAYDNFWANRPGPLGLGLQDSYAAAWRHVAERFRGDPSLVGYNLFNEPWPGTEWPACVNPDGCPRFDRDLLTPFHQRVIARIREVDQRAVVWYAPSLTFDFGADSNHGDTGDARAGFAFNLYCLATVPGLSSGPPGPGQAEGCEETESMTLENAQRQFEETGDALLMTEFAATDDQATIERVADNADRHMVGWQQWAYFNEDPCCERPQEGVIIDPGKPPSPTNVKQAKLDVSVRPYPQVVAGTPQSYGFDRQSKLFELEYSTARAGGGTLAPGLLTEVDVPPRQYPRGYRARVEGGRIVSETGARTLQIVACPGAESVSVTVTATGGTSGSEDCALERIRLTVSPARVRAGRRTSFRLVATVRSGGRSFPVTGATVRFAGATARTNSSGRATLVRSLRAGRHRATATRAGLEQGADQVVARPAQGRGPRGTPRFTG